MPILISLALMLGLFTEVRVPAEGYACLDVRYRHVAYKAVKFERSRLTGSVTLTLAPSFDPAAAILGQPTRSRVVQLKGYDVVSDSQTCECQYYERFRGSCVDE
jgi:hypothetical protein